MKIELKGIVKAREDRVDKHEHPVTYAEIEEGEQYKSQYRVIVKDAAVASQLKVGATVILSGFGDGRKITEFKNAQGEMVPYKFPRFEVYLKPNKVAVVTAASPAAKSASPAADVTVDADGVASDMPF